MRHGRPSTLTVAVVTAVALGMAVLGAMWFFSDSRAGARAHDDALALWESKEPRAYSFDYRSCSGMCDSCWLHVTVKNGEVTGVVARESRCSSHAQHAPSIEDIFAIEKWQRSAEWTDSFEIDYDPVWGFPALVVIRCPYGTADCGSSYEVTHFRARP